MPYLPVYDDESIDFDPAPVDLAFGALTIDEADQADRAPAPAPAPRPFGFIAFSAAYRPAPAPRPRPFGFVAFSTRYHPAPGGPARCES